MTLFRSGVGRGGAMGLARADQGRMESPEAIHRPCESALPSWGRSDSRCQMEPRRGSIWQRSDLGSLGRCQGGGLLYRRWKVDGEGCAFVGAAFDLEHAAVAIDEIGRAHV